MSKSKQRQRNRALTDAVLKNDTTSVQTLLQESGKIDLRDREHDETLLMLAARMAGPEMVQLLLDKGADIDARDGRGRTALIHALDASSFSNFQVLLKAGADVNVIADEGRTALIRAIEWVPDPDERIIRELIERGVDVNARDITGTTALSAARDCGLASIVHLLEARGAES